MKKPKRCLMCDKALRDWNKSGFCSSCGSRISRYRDSMVLVKKTKLLTIKKLVDELIEGEK